MEKTMSTVTFEYDGKPKVFQVYIVPGEVAKVKLAGCDVLVDTKGLVLKPVCLPFPEVEKV